MTPLPASPWRLSVAPMMEWTDRHCRYFHRLLTRRARLYSEMVTTGALLHGDVPHHLDFDAAEQPVALQLGGSEPAELAAAARLGERWGYAEINLNCGCPSERVQRGSFGACLMAEPALVADCVKAMRDAVSLPVTVKHRIGIDRLESYEFVREHNEAVNRHDFKENRELPPLRHEVVARLKRDFPALAFVVNGGVTTNAQIAAHLQAVDGVMIGREAYHHPWSLASWDAQFFGDAVRPLDCDGVEAAMVDYMEQRSHSSGEPWSRIARHMLGLRNGQPGARRWRQVWSDHRLKGEPARVVSRLARAAMAGQGQEQIEAMPA